MARKKKNKVPATTALRALDAAKADYRLHAYQYVEHGGTTEAAHQLGLDEHQVVKTLVMADSSGAGLVVLMHGDREVSLKALARAVGVKSIKPVDPATALRLTGYQVGGISPFGMRRVLPVYAQTTVLEMDRVVINAGRRGLLAELAVADLVRLLRPTPVQAARP